MTDKSKSCEKNTINVLLLVFTKPIKIILSLFAAGTISYLYVLNGDFLGDDIDRIVFNPELKSYWSAVTGGLGDRPLLMLITTFLSKTSNNSTIVFRLFSLFIHAMVSFQIYLFILELNIKNDNKLKSEIALASSFIFALHPLHNQSITTSIQLGVLLSGLFGLLSIRYFFKGISSARDNNFIRSVFLLVCGILAKPNIFFIPIFFLFNINKVNISKIEKTKILAIYFFVLTLPIVFYFFGNKNNQTYLIEPLKYFLIQTEVLFTYFKLMAIPYGLKFLYDFNVPQNIWLDTNWLFLIGHIMLIFLAVKKLSNPLLVTLFFGFYLSFLPESSFFPINHLAFEHRTYFPMIFLFLFFGTGLIQANLGLHLKKLISILSVGICLVYMILNQNRNIDIKRYGSWALHTLSNSTMYDYSNFFFSFLLARAGNFDDVEPFISKYPSVKKDQDYDALVDIFKYYKFPERKAEYFYKFLAYLEKPTLTEHARLFLNKIILEEYANKNDDPDKLIKIELNLAIQLDMIWEKRARFSQVLSNFQTLGKFILSSPFDSHFKKIDYLGYLKIKVYLDYYFNANFESLKSDLEAEQLKHPENKDIQKLLKKMQSK